MSGGIMKKIIGIVATFLFFVLGATPAVAADAASPTEALQVSANSDGVIVPSTSQLPVEVEYSGELLGLWQAASGTINASASQAELTVRQDAIGSAQFKISILNSAAPIEYPFLFKQGGATLQPKLNRFGAIDLVNADGDYVAFILLPWAKSANGSEVFTEFKVDGQTLIQVVKHRELGVSYPVEADPYLGIDLISSVSATLNNSGTAYNLKIGVTSWAGSLYVLYPAAFSAFTRDYALTGGAYAVYLMQTYGWAEVLAKLEARYTAQFRGYVYARATFKNQFDCHALGAPLIFAATVAGFDGSPTWDLEGHRLATTDLVKWVSYRCNW